MAELGGTKFTWVIKNFGSLQLQTPYSDTYKIGTTGCTCRFGAFSRINEPEVLCVCFIYCASWRVRRIYFKCRLTLVNQLSEELTIVRDIIHRFNPCQIQLGTASDLCIPNFHDEDGGYIVNSCVKIVVEVAVLEKLDKQVEVEKINKSMIKIEENNGAVSSVLQKEASAKMESVDVNGFQVFPSQVESVERIFERHPDIAVGFRAKNQHLRNACMNSLLGLIETLCQSLQELSNEDLIEADIALTYVKDAGFKVDWLEKNLKQVKEKKLKELSELTMLQETEEKLLKQKQKCAELEALVEKKKADLSATRSSLFLDDVV